jgi:hypothetical protein
MGGPRPAVAYLGGIVAADAPLDGKNFTGQSAKCSPQYVSGVGLSPHPIIEHFNTVLSFRVTVLNVYMQSVTALK